MIGGACACTGPRAGHGLCPCKEALLLERQRVRDLGLPTDQDMGHTIIGRAHRHVLPPKQYRLTAGRVSR